ncbi:PREDICTED: selenocysteine methyltransferase-like [Erythranthe guttata]|uniref:selenocysteine methyltransferase-like n=1 Tax=Erythranthe guttata TaxID=4155 RepID=UPI00064DB41F|nr:PREDICTED: selenocysteine methyltransferase-like [Erythranthe guttata]|eukprot:XP_012831099.1 PREDICTED: selenocysteine methyltransferase-like [Erythranthe guttata]
MVQVVSTAMLDFLRLERHGANLNDPLWSASSNEKYLLQQSVGSYGAYLADGSEYSGDYGDAMDLEFLKNFHPSGDSLSECVAIAESFDKIVAVGINCTPPRFISDLILSIKKAHSFYPNSGESYDADRKEWVQNTGVSERDFVSYVNKWCEVGSSLVGVCCRTTPHKIVGAFDSILYHIHDRR